MSTLMEWNVYKNFLSQTGCQTTNYQKPPLAYVVNMYVINLSNFLNSYTKDVIIYVLKVFWSRY